MTAWVDRYALLCSCAQRGNVIVRVGSENVGKLSYLRYENDIVLYFGLH